MDEVKAQKRTETYIVPAAYYDMFSMRMMGLNYKQIAEKTGYSHSWVRQLFAKGGVLYDLWDQWRTNEKAEKVEEALDMMFGHLPDVVRANIMHAKSAKEGAVLARKMLFEYTLGSPEQRVKVDAKIGIYTFSDWIKQKTEEEKQKNEQTDQQGAISETAD